MLRRLAQFMAAGYALVAIGGFVMMGSHEGFGSRLIVSFLFGFYGLLFGLAVWIIYAIFRVAIKGWD
jgi:hypothetical protein